MTMAFEDDPDEEFFKIIEGIELTTDVEEIDLSKLSNFELSSKFNDVRRKLADLEERIDPHTEEGIDLHALYHGYLLEMKKRGMA